MRLTKPLILALLLWGGFAQAHDSSISHSLWHIDDNRAEVRLRVSERDLRSNPRQDYAAALRLSAGGRSCMPEAPAQDLGGDGRWRNYWWSVRCVDPPERIESRLFPTQAPAHLHIAHIETGTGSSNEILLNAARAVADLQQRTPTTSGDFTTYLLSGIEHILLGWDHLAFLALLFLLTTGRREILLLVTGFTLAHSLTLGATVLGVLRPDAAAIEALIAFSIVLVAIENCWQLTGRNRLLPALTVSGLLLLGFIGGWALSGVALLGLALFTICYFALAGRTQHASRQWRSLLVLLFGLAHGCGFAGALLDVGLPQHHRVMALIGFNLGVEAGQLIVLALLLPLLTILSGYRRIITSVTAAWMGGLGMYWFVLRMM